MNMAITTDISILLEPKFYDDLPYVIVKIDDIVLFDDRLYKGRCITYQGDLSISDHTISVTFNNKRDDESDLVRGLDKAIIVKDVQFFGISNENIKNKGIYTPDYPTQYALDHTLEKTPQTYGYMGWNGVWELSFRVPIFTWLHKVEQLGWIYPT